MEAVRNEPEVPPGDMWECLEMCLTVTTGDCWHPRVEVRAADKYPTVQGQTLQQAGNVPGVPAEKPSSRKMVCGVAGAPHRSLALGPPLRAERLSSCRLRVVTSRVLNALCGSKTSSVRERPKIHDDF